MSDQELPAVLESLKAVGVRLAIDDFGTGTSVFTRLQTCQIDTLKIDRSFVKAITDEVPESPLIKALIALAHSLELVVVAEGVEARSAQWLRTHPGIPLFSRPSRPPRSSGFSTTKPRLGVTSKPATRPLPPWR